MSTEGRLAEEEVDPERLLKEFCDLCVDTEEIKLDFDPMDPHKMYLGVVLELLSEEEHAKCVERRWSQVLETVLPATAESQNFTEYSLAETAQVTGETSNQKANDLMTSVLGAVEDDEEFVRLLKEVVIPSGGFKLAEQCLDFFTKKDSNRVVPLLATFYHCSMTDLKKSTGDALVSLSSNPGILAEWAAIDPAGLLDRSVLTRVLEHRPDVSRRPFGCSSSTHQPRTLPSDVAGAESILFAAMDYGTRPVRIVSIENLSTCPSDVTLATLKAVLRRNNDKDVFDPEEVDATLTALVNLSHPGTEEYLHEVKHVRSLLTHVYLKDIRKRLADCLAERGPV